MDEKVVFLLSSFTLTTCPPSDRETEAVMKEIFDTGFRDCTVLAVMHRLKHVMRYEVVALLGDGKLLEMGESA